jgi:hypothetical protein
VFQEGKDIFAGHAEHVAHVGYAERAAAPHVGDHHTHYFFIGILQKEEVLINFDERRPFKKCRQQFGTHHRLGFPYRRGTVSIAAGISIDPDGTEDWEPLFPLDTDSLGWLGYQDLP